MSPNDRPSSPSSDVVEVQFGGDDARAPPSPEPSDELRAQFQFVDVDWSQPAAESQALGAATQQAMALSQRFLPCVPVQFDDFAPSQRHVTFADLRRDDDDGEGARTQRVADIRYGIPRAHKRLRADLLGEAFVEPPPAAADAPIVLSGDISEELTAQELPDEPPVKRARKKRAKKPAEPGPAPPPPPPPTVAVVHSDSPWASDVYEGASHLDARVQLVQRELALLQAQEKEKKTTKQQRALKKLSVAVAPIDVDATPLGRRRRTRKRKLSHIKPQ